MNLRLREERKLHKMNQAELGEAIGVTGTSIGNWETGNRLPPLEVVIKLAQYFGVTIDYLLGLSETRVGHRDLTGIIYKDQLTAMHATPVWIGQGEEANGWALVDVMQSLFRFTDGSTISFERMEAKIHGFPPAFALSFRGIGSPLSLSIVRKLNNIWVEPISPDTELRDELRGWYQVKSRYVENEFGNRFYFDRYGSKWVAFEHCLEGSSAI